MAFYRLPQLTFDAASDPHGVSRLVLRVALKFQKCCHSQDDFDDVVSEVLIAFVRANRAYNPAHPSAAAATSYFYRCAYNAGIRWVEQYYTRSRQGLRTPLPPELVTPPPDTPPLPAEDMRLLYEAIRRLLPPADQKILALRYSGLNCAEAAVASRRGYHTVRAAYQRVRRVARIHRDKYLEMTSA